MLKVRTGSTAETWEIWETCTEWHQRLSGHEPPNATEPCRLYEGENYGDPTGFIACATHGSFGIGWITRPNDRIDP